MHPPPVVRELDPTHLDEPGEAVAAEQVVVHERVAQVPVERDEVRHEVEHFGCVERMGVGLWAKSHTLIPAAMRPTICSSGDCPMWLMS